MAIPDGGFAGRHQHGQKREKGRLLSKKAQKNLRSAAAKFAAAQSRNPMTKPGLLFADPEYRKYLNEYVVDTTSPEGVAQGVVDWFLLPKAITVAGKGAWKAAKGGYRALRSAAAKARTKK